MIEELKYKNCIDYYNISCMLDYIKWKDGKEIN